ncbi:hypothetical protein PISMIDRAFT_26984 [Pisolithus microcarpus 441]|uniref:USP domain-containing protein n=1 Tax=Pisolithus microcarpus 441 TaxID=765257 RepID=A0A0D0ABW0_9AGAM|nr:hypothetical protein BKA83DRAFT_26984 [Pisolithus microcarpus]KIK29478.1 hypothetical protein PISMIDRAFT_26984 [Pisolithus microcarpus 441]
MLITDEAKEAENVKLLTEMMGDHSDREVARRVLRKYEGDVEKAATAMLEGERGDDDQSHQLWSSVSQMDVVSHKQPSVPSIVRPNTPVVDLTGDDDRDLQRAMKESMSTLQQPAPVFGPSERPADPNWAMVLSNQEGNHEANYLQNLERAIEASLEHSNANDSDALEPFPIEQQLRRDGCPVVLRPSIHTMCYAAAILQGLFYVPQVRERMASWRPTVMSGMLEVNVPTSGPDFTLWALSEIFTHMDLARLCDLNVDKHLCAFNIEPWTSLTNPLGELSRKFYTRLVATLEKAFVDQFVLDGSPPPNSRLFHFLYGDSAGDRAEVLQETSVVPIDINPGGGGSDANDLIGRLSAQLSKPQDAPEKQSVIVEPSEVVAFQLSKPSASYLNNTSTSAAAKPFVYPRSIYLDQFLKQNVAFAEAKRRQQHETFSNVQKLILHKKSMTHFNGKDTLKDLRSTIYYYEHVADDKGDPERTSSIKKTTEKLKSILEAVESEIKVTDQMIHKMREEALTLLDCPELKQVRYDLRVVFMHDGLYGRKHLYCYVRDKGQWWKIADSLIEQVTEESVLRDTTGLHLGAGPYLLLYSRYRPDENERLTSLPWPREIEDDVKECNKAFLAQLPPDLVKDIKEEHMPSSQNSTFSLSAQLTDPERRNDGMDVS